jgi:hypothetical protein
LILAAEIGKMSRKLGISKLTNANADVAMTATLRETCDRIDAFPSMASS